MIVSRKKNMDEVRTYCALKKRHREPSVAALPALVDRYLRQVHVLIDMSLAINSMLEHELECKGRLTARDGR